NHVDPSGLDSDTGVEPQAAQEDPGILVRASCGESCVVSGLYAQLELGRLQQLQDIEKASQNNEKGGGAPQNPEIVVNGKKPHNPQCEPAEGFQGWVEWGAGWGSELADDAATAAAFTGNEEIAAPAEAISWAFTGVKTVSQLSRGDTHG